MQSFKPNREPESKQVWQKVQRFGCLAFVCANDPLFGPLYLEMMTFLLKNHIPNQMV